MKRSELRQMIKEELLNEAPRSAVANRNQRADRELQDAKFWTFDQLHKAEDGLSELQDFLKRMPRDHPDKKSLEKDLKKAVGLLNNVISFMNTSSIKNWDHLNR